MAIDANSRIAPARPSSPAPNVRRVLRVCADCRDAIVEHAATVDPDEARALHDLATAIGHAAADWAAQHGGAR